MSRQLEVISFILFSNLFVIFAKQFFYRLPDERIVGGRIYKIEECPWQCSIQTVNGNRHICGGTLIQNKTVLTAAHCCDGKPASKIQIRAKSSFYDSGGVTSKISSISIHPKYDKKTDDYDFCLLNLVKPITTTFAVLPNSIKDSPKTCDDLLATGWGRLSEHNSSTPKQLRGVVIKFVNFKDCKKSYENKITGNMICAASFGKDTCQGDSGGPLTQKGKIYGVVSFGVGCANPKYPGVYARVASVLPWIKNNSK